MNQAARRTVVILNLIVVMVGEDEVVAIKSRKHYGKQPQKTQGVDNGRARKEIDNKKKDSDSSKKEQVKSGSGGEEVVPSRKSHGNEGRRERKKMLIKIH